MASRDSLLRRSARMLEHDCTMAEVRSMLREEGLSEADAYLVYEAAKILAGKARRKSTGARTRPPTVWLEHAAAQIHASDPSITLPHATRIAASMWWKKMGAESKAAAATRHEPAPELVQGLVARGRRIPTTMARAPRLGAAKSPPRAHAPQLESHGYPRLPAGRNHQHPPGPRKCPKCGV